MNNDRNWKQAFFILLGSIILLVAVMFGAFLYLVLSPPESENPTKVEVIENPYFRLVTNKAGINSWIHKELSKREQKIKNIHYDVMVDDYIYVNGKLIVFNREIPFQMIFEPSVNQDKGLTLTEKEVSLGMLNLPGEIVLGLLDEQFNMPEWVTIHPNQHEIVVDVKEIELEKGMQLSLETFDLSKDKIELNLKR
ncbi:DUF2140 family protein [Bacillus suaedaesalsae]|uniref:YpmS family protein n=1 Tax=Bacillus suaedaesalsae TaxID=2810349 RepID=A0ABS2DFF6_9BACI|nr:YpmS family protein [Bacillus suaedaesalsae]